MCDVLASASKMERHVYSVRQLNDECDSVRLLPILYKHNLNEKLCMRNSM